MNLLTLFRFYFYIVLNSSYSFRAIFSSSASRFSSSVLYTFYACNSCVSRHHDSVFHLASSESFIVLWTLICILIYTRFCMFLYCIPIFRPLSTPQSDMVTLCPPQSWAGSWGVCACSLVCWCWACRSLWSALISSTHTSWKVSERMLAVHMPHHDMATHPYMPLAPTHAVGFTHCQNKYLDLHSLLWNNSHFFFRYSVDLNISVVFTVHFCFPRDILCDRY